MLLLRFFEPPISTMSGPKVLVLDLAVERGRNGGMRQGGGDQFAAVSVHPDDRGPDDVLVAWPDFWRHAP